MIRRERVPAADVVAAAGNLQGVLDVLPRAIFVTDTDGRVVYWNRVAVDVYGYAAADAIGAEAFVDVIPSGDDDAARARIDDVLAGSTWRGDLTVRFGESSPMQIFVIMAPLRDDDGRVVGAVVAGDDITELRAVENQAAELNAQLLLALDAGGLGTWRWDMATGVTVWDERLEALFGLPPGGFDGTFDAYVALLHPDERDTILATVQAALRDRSGYQLEHRVIWPDGTERWLQGRGRVTLDQHGNPTGTVGCTGDITDMKRAEQRAQERVDISARMIDEERRQRERLEFLAGLTDASVAAADHLAFMAAVTAAAVPRLGDWCSLHFIPEPGAEVEVEVAHADPDKVAWARALTEQYPFNPDAPSGVAAVIRSGVTEYIEEVTPAVIDAALEESPIARDEAVAILEVLSLTSVITVPLRTKRGVIGAMQFVSAESGRRYERADVALAEAASGRIAEALDNMWLTDEHRHISATLQRSLLPPRVPAIPGVDLTTRYSPAGAVSEVGGDFYDVFALDESTWAVVIGDVCGTGPNAAALTGMARHTVRAAARHGQDHVAVLEWLNEAVRMSDRDLFCTCCYATLVSRDDGWLLTSNAGGHPLPVIVRAGVPRSLGTPGSLIGVFDPIHTHPATARLEPGDVVVFYTDGVTDLPPPNGLTTDEAMALMATVAAHDTADGIADAILASLSQRLPPTQRQDDIALVVLRLGESGSPPV